MVGLPYDCLANPLGAVRLRANLRAMTGESPISSMNFSVPLLNPTTIKRIQPNTLVRFRGMIQDMLGNEFYVGAFKDGDVWRTNKFADVSQYPMSSSPEMRVWERRLLYCVTVPGQNSWAESTSEAVVSTVTNSTSPQREKRQREDDTSMDAVDMQAPGHEMQDSPSVKRKRDDGIPSQPMLENTIGRTCSNTSTVQDFDRNSFPCLVKIYDSPESDLKLNDLFEFVGVLTYDTELEIDKEDNDERDAGFIEDAISHLPPSKVPRIHCLIQKKLSAQDFLSSPPTFEAKPYLVKGIREALLGHLTAVLGNDGLAAQFMLLHLLSRVHARVDAAAIGKLSLNLTCFSSASISIFGNRLNHAIRNLVPFTHFIPLTVDYLNSGSLAPRKDYQTNRLVTGVLQLPEGSHLTIDETRLKSGSLDSSGVENSRILQDLVESQKVEYDFTYYKLEMAADLQLLILSEGKSNIIPADLVLPLHPCSVDSPEIVDPEVLKAWRWYLAAMRSVPHSIEQDMQKVVEDDLVAARQADPSLGSKQFSRLLTMGRLLSASFGETRLSLDHWQMVKELERLRNERLQGNM